MGGRKKPDPGLQILPESGHIATQKLMFSICLQMSFLSSEMLRNSKRLVHRERRCQSPSACRPCEGKRDSSISEHGSSHDSNKRARSVQTSGRKKETPGSEHPSCTMFVPGIVASWIRVHLGIDKYGLSACLNDAMEMWITHVSYLIWDHWRKTYEEIYHTHTQSSSRVAMYRRSIFLFSHARLCIRLL